MKIGILTFHRAYNYGAILQAYALQKKIEELRCECEIIDYLSLEKQKQTKLFGYNPKIGLKGNFIKFFKDIYRVGKNKQFNLFMKEEMTLSENRYSTFDELTAMDRINCYDTYIVGSDQVWNINNNRRDKSFLLSFVSDDKKRCSYAASIGSAVLDEEMIILFEQELKKYRVLTVREESAIQLYSFLKDYRARVVLDPTLLLKNGDYQLISSRRLIKKKYSFLYTIEEDRNLRKYAREFCNTRGMALVDSKKSIAFFKYSNPRDFLSFVINAEYVFTNSFHGTAFSLIFKKQFVTEVHTRKRLNNRSRDLLENINLLNRDIDDKQFAIDDTIDWNEVYDILNALREISVEILQEIVSG